ncbi:MAG: linear amide C-N hydrolase [Planctomycetia bacterium]|nr:linear amide C-N hydrolase [Planctomycetia bacterium]
MARHGKLFLVIFVLWISVFHVTVHAESERVISPKKYTAAYLTTQAQADSLDSLTAENDAHTFFQMKYTADYKLDALLKADIQNMEALAAWVQENLLKPGAVSDLMFGGGCSVFMAKNPEGKILCGRNYDQEQNAQNILVHVVPGNGDYESYCTCAGGWIFQKGRIGRDEMDVSLLAAAPYLLMDGMNEKGLVVSVLQLDGRGTAQQTQGKNSIQTTVAMRLVLDRAASVEQALNLLTKYNMHSALPDVNFHFFFADASGHYCILEYEPENGGVRAKGFFDATDAFPACRDPKNTYRQVTNFYKLYKGHDDGSFGLERYNTIKKELKKHAYTLNEENAMQLLAKVRIARAAQWSVVYNSHDFTAKFCVKESIHDVKKKSKHRTYDYRLTFGKHEGL